jgi:hypothetical protein
MGINKEIHPCRGRSTCELYNISLYLRSRLAVGGNFHARRLDLGRWHTHDGSDLVQLASNSSPHP